MYLPKLWFVDLQCCDSSTFHHSRTDTLTFSGKIWKKSMSSLLMRGKFLGRCYGSVLKSCVPYFSLDVIHFGRGAHSCRQRQRVLASSERLRSLSTKSKDRVLVPHDWVNYYY
ncbi:unnamed protein product [Amoebophrya sp. A25]|nr:unnamed protein product [Amoebophrya sp. A25]|eukprot:GSA25T00006158001.1